MADSYTFLSQRIKSDLVTKVLIAAKLIRISLGPLRPYFFGFWLSTILMTGIGPIIEGMSIQLQQSWILLTWILACMPELVPIWNTIIRL